MQISMQGGLLRLELDMFVRRHIGSLKGFHYEVNISLRAAAMICFRVGGDAVGTACIWSFDLVAWVCGIR